MTLTEILLNIAKELLETPESLTCELIHKKGVDELTLKPKSEQDVPRLIGKKGRTITAMRTLLRAINNSRGNERAITITVKDIAQKQ